MIKLLSEIERNGYMQGFVSYEEFRTAMCGTVSADMVKSACTSLRESSLGIGEDFFHPLAAQIRALCIPKAKAAALLATVDELQNYLTQALEYSAEQRKQALDILEAAE